MLASASELPAALDALDGGKQGGGAAAQHGRVVSEAALSSVAPSRVAGAES